MALTVPEWGHQSVEWCPVDVTSTSDRVLHTIDRGGPGGKSDTAWSECEDGLSGLWHK